jgi:hypothetical protein
MYKTSPLFQWYKTTIKQMCSYANVVLFTSDSPSAKEKKHEKRCADIIDSFYTATIHVLLSEALNNVKTDLLLGRNEVVVKELLTDYGVLQATLEYHIKDVSKKVKPEQVLVEYYKVVGTPEDFFVAAFNDLSKLLPTYVLDIDVCKHVYYDAYKERSSQIKIMKEEGVI